MTIDTTDTTSLNKSRRRIHELGAEARLSLVMKGDEIANKENYPVDGLDAIYYYLFDKRGLDPVRVSKMHSDAIEFLLSKEFDGWVRPSERRHVTAPDDVTKSRDKYEISLALFQAQAASAYHTELFGDFIGERENYGEGGREALEIYLCRKFGYQPYEVSSWSWETIASLLAPEVNGWKSPAE